MKYKTVGKKTVKNIPLPKDAAGKGISISGDESIRPSRAEDKGKETVEPHAKHLRSKDKAPMTRGAGEG